jgi:hypothetical protein
MHLIRLYDQVFVTYILQMFNECTASGSAFKFLTLRQQLMVCVLLLYFVLLILIPPPENSNKVRASGGIYTAFLMCPKKKIFKENMVRRSRWPVVGPPLPIHFSGNFRFKDFVTSLWKCGGTPSCWNGVSTGLCSYKVGMRNSSVWNAVLTSVNVALRVERFGNSSGTNYELDHITDLNAYNVLSFVFQTVYNVTVKWHTFHMHILHYYLFSSRFLY